MDAAAQYGDDAEVIAASLTDAERFAVVFDRHAPHIHRYLARRLGSDGQLRFVANGEQIQLPGCVKGVRRVDGNPPTAEACSVDPAYLLNAPTTAAAWTTFLDQQFGPDLGAQEKGIVTTLADHYISPAST
jgi:hypothetical protein